jgi:nicotinamidase-related amidase
VILLVIDVQAGLDDPAYGPRSNPSCENKIGALLSAFRQAAYPVIYTRHFSLRPGSRLSPNDPGSQIKNSVAPLNGELVFTKTTNSAFKDAGFSGSLHEFGTRELVLVGIATDACVTATAREAKDLGYHVTVVSDGCATFSRASQEGGRYAAELVNDVSLAALAASGMRVCTAAELLREVATAAPQPRRPA